MPLALMGALNNSEGMPHIKSMATSFELRQHRDRLQSNGTSISEHSGQILRLETNLEGFQNGVTNLCTRLANVESTHQQLDSHMQTNRGHQEEIKATLTQVVKDIGLIKGKCA